MIGPINLDTSCMASFVIEKNKGCRERFLIPCSLAAQLLRKVDNAHQKTHSLKLVKAKISVDYPHDMKSTTTASIIEAFIKNHPLSEVVQN